MHQHLSACLSSSLCPVLAASTIRAVLPEYIKSIFVYIILSSWLYQFSVSKKKLFMCVQWWCSIRWLDFNSHGPDRRSSGLVLFAGNDRLECCLGPSVPKHTQKRRSAGSTSRSNLQLLNLDVMLCYVFKIVPFLFFFCSEVKKTVTYLSSQSAYGTSWDKGHCEDVYALTSAYFDLRTKWNAWRLRDKDALEEKKQQIPLCLNMCASM